jgi:hypothetical protein
VKLTPKKRELLERIRNMGGRLLELQLAASGGPSYDRLSELRSAGYVELCDHPTVVDRKWNEPAKAVRITEAGEAALRERIDRAKEPIAWPTK